MSAPLLQPFARIALVAFVLLGVASATTAQSPGGPPGGPSVKGTDGVGGIERLAKGQVPPPPDPDTGSVSAETWVDLGQGIAGQSGTPLLDGSGAAQPGSVVSLRIDGAQPEALANLVIGLGEAALPFKGGTLVPSPDLIVAGLALDATGSHSIPATVPAGLNSGTTLYLQAWMVDAGAAQGFAASNALLLIVP